MRQLGYVPALDGIRGYAVMLVMLSHSNFQWFKNGSLGVSAFFALSGFLITKLILEEIEVQGGFSFKAFYCRRAFRLLPALFVVLVATFIYIAFFNTALRESVLDELGSAALFVYNIAWAWGVKSVMLYHTWSLGIEEQFYLLWPPMLVVLVKSANHKYIKWALFIALVIALGALMLQSRGSRIILSLISPAIILGCGYAWLLHKGVLRVLISRTWAYLIFISMICFFISPFRFVGMGECFALLTICLIHYLLYAKPDLITSLLTNKPIRFLGKISYGLYLWHLPVFKVFAFHPIAYGFIYKFLVAFLIAVVSWFLLEKPLIEFGRFWSKKLKT